MGGEGRSHGKEFGRLERKGRRRLEWRTLPDSRAQRHTRARTNTFQRAHTPKNVKPPPYSLHPTIIARPSISASCASAKNITTVEMRYYVTISCLCRPQ